MGGRSLLPQSGFSSTWATWVASSIRGDAWPFVIGQAVFCVDSCNFYICVNYWRGGGGLVASARVRAAVQDASLGQTGHTLSQSVTFVKILIRMNVRIYLYQQNCTNEYPNIFILIFWTRTNVRISIRIENCTNIRIYSNIRLGFTL